MRTLSLTSHALVDDVGPDVEVLQLGVALALTDDQRVLLHQILLLSLLGLSVTVLLLHLLYEAERSTEVGAGSRDFTGLFHVGAAVSPTQTTIKSVIMSTKFSIGKTSWEQNRLLYKF